ncbi:MAG: DUF2441 domain-containing protein [Clostridiales bacterium]|nr:DUF2441 domain-containing protein [Clostridiales bacterium]
MCTCTPPNTEGDKPMITEVYHVVTERRMALGQVIQMDENTPTGVYSRVMDKKSLVEDMLAHPERYAGQPIDHHTDVAIRELAMEQVRREQYPQCPSRMHSLYTSRDVEDSRCWFQWFKEWGRATYQIVKLRVDGRCFTGNANLCFDGGLDQAQNRRYAERYWQVGEDPDGERPVWETLVDGRIEVVEIIYEEDGEC